ncbi:MAG: response regulator, partial [Leptospiraceae bacterium]|nr:response regulator [Leptospiraceae bacterium]
NNFNKIKFNEKKKIKRIYLLDDEEIQLLFNKHLILKFFPDKEVETYSDPEEMLKNLKNSKELPDKLFLDLFMPELTGWEVLEILEQNSINIDVTIISSSIDPRDMEKASKYSNVSSYITKPLSPEKIKEELKVH